MPQACVTKSTPPVYRKLPVTSPSTYTPPSYKRTPPNKSPSLSASPWGVSFLAWSRRARNASDWWWTARNHGKGTVVSFPPSSSRTFSSRERCLVRGSLCTLHRNKLNLFWRYKAYFNISKCKRILISTAVACFEAPFCSLWHNPLCL